MVTLYSIGCPKCNILEKKLNDAGITYLLIDDRRILEKKGFDFMPVLEVDDKMMNYNEAINWVNERSYE